MITLSRRQFLASVSVATIAGTVASGKYLSLKPAAAADLKPRVLRVVSRTIEVNGKPAKVYGLEQPDGTSGIVAEAGQFRVSLENHSEAPTLVHWHGLLPPYGQDGVPDLPQPLLPAGASYEYDFPLKTPGTHWMHAHTLQEQQLLAAPLIVADPTETTRDEQQVVALLHDFSFKSPEELLAGLRSKQDMSGMTSHDGMSGMGTMSEMPVHDKSTMAGGMTMDVNDIDYDAYLANDRTLEDPEIFRTEPGGIVRLRLINGATATAFWIDLGDLAGKVMAVDGNPVHPISGRRFPLGMGQRLDIRIRLPKTQGAWPIVALREGGVERTGFVLATKAGKVRRIAKVSEKPSEPLDSAFEASLEAVKPLDEKAPDRTEDIALAGDMAKYAWSLSRKAEGQDQSLPVRSGDRVEVKMVNQSMMGHPMHLHGHHFQVVAIDGQRIAGAVRDTVWVPPMREVTVAFDATNPGTWAFHCHHLYHMASGMMTTVKYET
jgi:FtsP/CotA-like multicopper oxidase with cupredoxin domain